MFNFVFFLWKDIVLSFVRQKKHRKYLENQKLEMLLDTSRNLTKDSLFGKKNYLGFA
jgi:hypothetical protein